ncbi:hypothetical protein [Halorubrum sp. C191]|uniref:hypothetical protein n=1 Tax=Halorubrum sp. C191 TaxID=1383842 RepID=UPI00118186E6|nr:hypothetical protein [Halorubrum sp. C191]
MATNLFNSKDDASYESQYEEALSRHKIIESILTQSLSASFYRILEGGDEVDEDLDHAGIDAVADIDDQHSFLALKTRNLENFPFGDDPRDVDVALRKLGRNGGKSEEYGRYISDNAEVPHLLIFVVLHKDKPVRHMVLDFRAMSNNRDEIDETEKWSSVPSDDGKFVFLDSEDVREFAQTEWTHPEY